MNASIDSLPSRAKPRRASNLWPVSIIAFFVVFVGGLTAFIVFASNQQDDLVRADYYEEELRYQLQLDRINRTQLIPDRADVRYDAERQRITIALPKGHATGSSGRIQLYRPADARLDREVALAVGSDGFQHVDARSLRGGLWKVRVRWSIAGQEYFVDQPLVLPTS